MRNIQTTVAAMILLGSVTPALAISCVEEISTVERRLNSSGAEKATGIKPEHGATSSNSPKALEQQPEGEPSDPNTKPSGPGVLNAKAMIAKARDQAKAGDEQGCQATMTKVKETAGALP